MAPTNRRKAYVASFRRHVHALLVMAYDRLDRCRLAEADEPSITGELVRAMRQAMAEDRAPRWVTKYSIRDDPPLDSPGRYGRSRPRVDIEFEKVQRGPRPCYHWEAKKLKGGSSCASYVGDEGLGCYLSGKYARDHREAGMLGYVLTHDELAWAVKIQKKLEENPEESGLVEGGTWTHVNVVPQLAHSYRTKHKRRAGGRLITVYHALLRFC